MIVNATKDGWQIIYHRAHALLAAQLAGAWLAKTRPPHWIEIITAISGHDDLAKEWEAPALTDAGAPQDFRLSTETAVDVLRDLDVSARYRGRWVALLTSMHSCFLNDPKRGELKALDHFLDEQTALQTKWRRDLKITKAEAESAYAFMAWCDRLSLILCLQQIPARERWLEICNGPDGKRYNIQQRNDGSLNIDPWPFGEDRLPVSIEAVTLKQLKFKDSAELSEALQAAKIETLTWEFCRDKQSDDHMVAPE